MDAAVDPRLEPCVQRIADFLEEHGVPGAAVAVTKNSRLVLAHGFGWADEARSKPVAPTHLFRIASLSKPLTAVAILQQVEAGRLRLDDRLLDVIPDRPWLPAGVLADSRLGEITIVQLLQHMAGWDSAATYDPISRPAEIALAMRLDHAPSADEVLHYSLGLPLASHPGERFAYSNVGYLALGRVLEVVSGRPYEQLVRECIWRPLGCDQPRLGVGSTVGRPATEVDYLDGEDRWGPALRGPNCGQPVKLPDGAENLEAFGAHGGWIASAVDLAKFLMAFDRPGACPVLSADSIERMWASPSPPVARAVSGQPAETWYGCGWNVRDLGQGRMNQWHMGWIAGTAAIMVRRHDAINWVLLMNSDTSRSRPGEYLGRLVDPVLHEAVNSVRKWPESP